MATDNGDTTERTPLLHVEPDPVDGPSPLDTTSTDAAGERDGTPAEGLSRLRGSLIFICLGVLIFLHASNISLMTTTQGFISEELDAFREASWFTSSFLIASSSLAPLGGRICKIASPRAYITFSTLVFSTGAIITSQATTLAVFLLGRVITGLGAAGVFSVSMILVLKLSSAKTRGLYIGLLNSGFTFGVSFGAVIAGAMVEPLGWRPIFWIQAPIASTAGVGIFFASPTAISTPEGGRKQRLLDQLLRIDYLGALTWVVTIVLFLYGMSAQQILPLPLLISLGTLALFILIESNFASEPVIPVSVLRSRGTFFSCLATVGLMMARWTVLFYTPVYTIAVRSWSQAEAGLILLPTNFGFGIGGLLAGWIHIRRSGSFYLSCITAFLLFAASLFLLANITTATSSGVGYMFAVFANGLVTGAILNYTMAHLLHLTSSDVHTIVTPLLATFRGFAGSFGSAIGGGIFTRTLKQALEAGFSKAGLGGKDDLIKRLLGSPALAARLDGMEREVAVQAFQMALKTLFLAGTTLALVATLVQAGTGWRGPEETKSGDLEEDLVGPDEEHHRSS